jgi:hypothetical protein
VDKSRLWQGGMVPSQCLRELIGVGHNQPTLSAGDHFAAAKAIETHITDGPQFAIALRNPHGLRSILNQHDGVGLAQHLKAIEVGGNSEQMTSDHAKRFRSNHTLEFLEFEVECPLVDITQSWS